MFKQSSTSLILLGILSVIVGIIAFAWPGVTVYALVEVVGGFGRGETAGTRAMFILTGLVSVAFGVLLFARPDVGAVTLALLFGLFSLIYGISEITLGIQLRRTGRTLQPILPEAA